MQKGFTLTELLVVIVLMGVVGGIATMSILTSLVKGKNETNMMMENNLADAAVTYALAKKFLKTCPTEFVVNSENYYNLPITNSECFTKVKTSFLIDEGYFKDDGRNCAEDVDIVVYNFVSLDSNTNQPSSGEYRAYVPKGTCQS